MMGGTSTERVISLESGEAVLAALMRKGISAHSVDPKQNLLDQLQRKNFDRAFIALHGQGGEDGLIQGLLEVLGLPYTGSGILGSALAIDKSRAKRVWQSHGIPTPAFVELDEKTDYSYVVDRLGLPLAIKPVRQGSSYGISKVNALNEFKEAWGQASEYDTRVMAEAWVEGTEYTIPILGDSTLPAIRLETPREFYDYEAKYVADTTQYICPCGLEDEIERELSSLSMDAFYALSASGWGRVDLMIGKDEQPWFLEVNTVPGLTSHSLVPIAALQVGLSFDELTLGILATSLERGK